jgi:uncharacterized protein (TIGR03435 family)
MASHGRDRSSWSRFPGNALAVTALLMLGAIAAPAWAQCEQGQALSGTPPVGDRMAAAGGKMSFDVVSVKPGRSNAERTSNFPLGPGEVYAATGGRFCATNTPAMIYLMFAYKLSNQERLSIREVPGWMDTDGFDIEARGPTSATKDQMRLMMQGLLADRFKLVLRHETRQSPAFALAFAKSGKLGPQLQTHSDGAACGTGAPGGAPPAKPSAPSSTSGLQLDQIPCGGIFALPPSARGRVRFGAKNIAPSVLVSWLTNPFTGVDRPVFDRTDLKGTFDFALEFSPAPDPARPGLTPDDTAPTFMQALQEQLGLKLESTTGPLDVIVINHVERPSEN